MEELAKLPKDMVFYTQMTMEAGEDVEFLDAMKKANIKGALVGIEAVTPEGLKAVYKDWNLSGDAMARQLQTFKSTAFMCWARLSLGCRRTGRLPSTPRWRWRKRRASPLPSL